MVNLRVDDIIVHASPLRPGLTSRQNVSLTMVTIHTIPALVTFQTVEFRYDRSQWPCSPWRKPNLDYALADDHPAHARLEAQHPNIAHMFSARNGGTRHTCLVGLICEQCGDMSFYLPCCGLCNALSPLTQHKYLSG